MMNDALWVAGNEVDDVLAGLEFDKRPSCGFQLVSAFACFAVSARGR